MIKVGILGYGFFGFVFYVLLFVVLDEYYVSKVMILWIEEVKWDFLNVEVVYEFEEIINDLVIEFVIVIILSDFYYEYVMVCIQVGKYVVMEKLMIVMVEEGEKLKKVVDEKGVLLSVYYN